ncbi:VOC family protein [Sphingobacterium hungaricum]
MRWFYNRNAEETVSTSIQGGATIVESPKTKPWGRIVAYVRDIDGFLIEICKEMS